ncbi:MAG: DUF1801 domain-containing protein [Nannocystis sp.]|nr:DUF1801 domain-containing protein [Nannocystis sp.]MBA3549084.1 DUF1801 domain-containing protein [Nannocystis sp.]
MKTIARTIEEPTAKKAAKKKTAKKTTAKKTASAKKPAAKKTAKATTASAKKTTAKKTAKKAAAKKTTTKKVPKTSPLKTTPIAEFVLDRLSGWQAEAVEALCALVLSEAPEATQAIKWSQPVFELGGPFAFIRLAAKHVTFGFWRGADLKDPRGVLEGEGDRMKHIKLRSATLDEPLLRGFIRQAIKLNATRGDPTRR